ncbi:MAG: serine hydrolase [Verrucomicrobiales bacterium]
MSHRFYLQLKISIVLSFAALYMSGCITQRQSMMATHQSFEINQNSQVDPELQSSLKKTDSLIRTKHGMTPDQTAVGLLDLKTMRLAMIHPDRGEYAASIPKIGIMLAYFQLHPDAATNLDEQTRHELGLMIKASSNEMAAKFSNALGLKEIQAVLNHHGFYDADHGGGIWVGKHYGKGGERYGDPLGNNSHAATVRQLLRFYLLLEQGKLISPQASKTMRDIFESPGIPHDDIKFVKGLKGRPVEIIRKWGSWQDWLHDSAVVKGEGKHYILVALTRHPKGDDYLEELAGAVHRLL